MIDSILAHIKEARPVYDVPVWSAAVLISWWDNDYLDVQQLSDATGATSAEISRFLKFVAVVERKLGADVLARRNEDQMWESLEGVVERFVDESIKRAFSDLYPIRNTVVKPLELSWKRQIHPDLVLAILRVVNNLPRFDDDPPGGSGIAASFKPPPWLPRGLQVGRHASNEQDLPDEETG